MLRPFLIGLIPLVLVACGSDDTSTISSAVYSSHSVVLVQSVTKSWGANGYGQLGIGSATDRPKPVTVPENFSAVSIGGAHSVALDTAAGGNVMCWGRNASGQLGDGTFETRTSPVPVLVSLGSALTGVKAIAAGGNHTIALKIDGTVWAWGENLSGQVGDGMLTNRSFPVQVLSEVKAIAAGGSFSLALKNDGTVWAWGSNSKGQLGNNDPLFTSSAVPVQVVVSGGSALTGIKAIAAGGSHALALNDTGTILYAWGYNELGQLGDGTVISRNMAVEVDTTGEVTAISAGLDHSLAVIGGRVYAWGFNYHGQLGNGAALLNAAPVMTPQTVIDQDDVILSFIVDVIATGHHSIARDTNGTIWTWGNNAYGQLGDGTAVSRSKANFLTFPAP